jgi:hypothetical protein
MAGEDLAEWGGWGRDKALEIGGVFNVDVVEDGFDIAEEHGARALIASRAKRHAEIGELSVH